MTGPDEPAPFEDEIPAVQRTRRRAFWLMITMFMINIAASVVEHLSVPPGTVFVADTIRFVTTPAAMAAALVTSRAAGWLDGVQKCNTWWKVMTRAWLQ